MFNYEQYLQVCKRAPGLMLIASPDKKKKKVSRTRELHSRIQVKLMQFSLETGILESGETAAQ